MSFPPPAIRLITSTSSKLANIYLQCHIKPGARNQRDGILAINDHVIDVCVSAQPRDGEANKAVRIVFSEALRCPKTDVEVVKGLKSKEKTVGIAVTGLGLDGDEKGLIERVRKKLERAMV